MNEGQIIARGLLITGCHAPVMLDPIDKPLHEVPALVQPPAKLPGCVAVVARRDHGLSATLANRLDQCIRIVALVGDDRLGFMLRQQFLRASHVMFFAGAKTKFQRLALGIYRQVQLATEASTGAAEGFLARFFFSGEPAAC